MKNSGVENATKENVAQYCRGGKCATRKWKTIMRGVEKVAQASMDSH